MILEALRTLAWGCLLYPRNTVHTLQKWLWRIPRAALFLCEMGLTHRGLCISSI